MVEDNIVIVVDTSNYKPSFSEKVPFKAKIVDKYDINIVVKSLESKKEYELYSYQILEGLDIEKIRDLVNLNKY